MKKLKELDYSILFELLKNSKTSDRKLARRLGVSQPTITRRRANLEKEGYLTYTGVPNFAKLGLRIMAFNFVTWNAKGEKMSSGRSEDFMKKVSSFLHEYPNVIFASTGRGMGMGRISISLHKNYADYVEFLNKLYQEWGEYLAKQDSFIVSMESDNVVKQISFDHLVDYVKSHHIRG